MRTILLAFGLCSGLAGPALADDLPAVDSVDTLEVIPAAVHPDSVSVIEVSPVDSNRTTAAADTVYTSSSVNPLRMEQIDVSARRVTRVAGADRVELDQELVDSRDGGSVADLVSLLPSTKLTVNSRGESLFMVRGSSERHLRVELDGIPLTVNDSIGSPTCAGVTRIVTGTVSSWFRPSAVTWPASVDALSS